MKGKWTKQYDESFREVVEELLSELKAKLKTSTYETSDDIAVQLSHQISERQSNLRWATLPDGERGRSWFRNEVIEKYHQDKTRFKDGYQVDGFLELVLPEIKNSFKSRYESANEITRRGQFFDHDFAESSGLDGVVKLLACEDAYSYFLENKFKVKDEQIEIIEKEKQLDNINQFNSLSPVTMLDFFSALSDTKSKNGEPYLSEKQVYDLVNAVCRNGLDAKPISLNIGKNEKGYVTRFFYEFYKYCQDTVDSKATRTKYIEILEHCITISSSGKPFTVNKKNFADKQPNSPIRIDEKYVRWKNA